ncbi:hypothetical protein HJD18_14125 [Thermoleophilia bacterium SCSIO 60948]|nr:hypothetical protein HJD18_14125 [Thermoleophilia bacterium SCSIO 60948]
MNRRAPLTLICLGFLASLALTPGAQAAGGLPGFEVKTATKRAPVVVRAKAQGIRGQVSFRVNGKRVDPTEVYANGVDVRYAELSASDGLKPGPNTIEARRSSGTRASGPVGRLEFRLAPRELLADAGEDASAIESASAVSVGSPARGGTNVSYDWKPVGAPPGADFELEGDDESRPTLAAATPGVYRLRVTASKEGEPAARASHDQVAVTVNANTPPIGAPLNTLASNGAIQIGTESYGAGAEIAWVVLSRSAGTVVESGTVTRSDAGMSALNATAEKYRDRQRTQRHIMIVSGRTGVPDAQLGAFGQFLKKVGANVPTADNFQALRNSKPFSVVGVPGGARGAATTRFAPSMNLADPPSGAIEGYLQQNQAVDADGGAIYDVQTPEHITYDTKSASTATSNTMRIGSVNYVGTLPANATAGLHVVALNGLTGGRLWEEALATNGNDPDGDAEKQTATATRLADILNTPGANPILFVQTIGKPLPAGRQWDAIVKQLRRVGANANYVYGLDETTTYALVGALDSTAPPNESSDAYDKGPYGDPGYPTARLRGVISRGRDSRLVPTTSGTPTPQAPTGAINTDLVDITWQSPQAFPQLAPGASDAERKAVTDWFCKEKLGFCATQDSCTEIRACYWQQYGLQSSAWASKRAAVTGATYPGGSPGFTQAQFDSVKAQIGTELGWLVDVKAYSESLQRPFVKVQGRAQVDLQTISTDIYNGLQRPPAVDKTSFVLDLIGKAIKIGSVLGPPISGIASGVGAMFDTAAYLSKDRTGAPVLGEQVKTEAARLGQELSQRYDVASQQIDNTGLMLVSDFGKLQAAAAKINNDPNWKLPVNDTVAVQQLENGAKQWFYTSLVPAAYPYLIRGNTNNARAMDCIITDDKRAWPNQPDDAQMYWTVGYNAANNPIRNIFFFARGMGGAMSPPGGLGTKMFAPRIASSGPTGLGMEKLEFFTPRVFGGAVAHAINGDRGSRCRVGWLPQGW